MRGRASPALVPALGVLAGALAGLDAAVCRPALAVALLAAATAARGRTGLAAGGLALGLLAAAVQAGGELPPAVDPSRPVVAVGRVVDHWRSDGGEGAARFRLEWLRQGPRVEGCGLDVWLVLPGSEGGPPAGSRLRVRGRLARSRGFANGVRVPPGPWRLRVKSRRLVERVGDPPWAAALAARVRRAVEQAHAAAAAAAGRDAATGPGLGLVRALVLADAGAVPEGWRRGLRRSGLAHLLAVSGLHVGLVAATALLLAAPLPWRGRLLVGLAAVAGYLLLAGPRPALLRAALMALLAVVALLGERTPSAPNALAVAVALLVLQRPALVTDLGFRLTATATAGIVLLGPCLERGWRRRGREGPAPSGWPGGRAAEAVVRALAATVAAQLASLPVAAPSFHLVSLTAPLGNLVAVPWTALTLAAGLGWSLLALLDPRPAAACLPLLDLLAAPFGWPAAGSPAAWGTVPAVAPVVASSLLAAAVAAWAARPLRRAALLLVAAALLPAWRWGDGGPRAHGGIELVIFDVGQGDAILLRDGDGAVLVDGGGWPRGDLGGRVLLPALAHEGVTELRAVVLTHGDRDHCGGLVDLASYMSLGEVWLGAGQPPGEGCATELTAAAATQGARVRRVAAGDRARLGRWRIRVLHPPAGERPARDNDASLVLLAEARGRRVLLAGDLEARGEGALVGRWGDGLRAEVLKVAHHGSGGSSGAGFLAAVGARLALVSAGAGNPYGHPAPAALARLSRGRSAVLRTDRDGCLHLAWGQGAGAGPAPLRVGVARPP